jgi:tetratricopeptide (TPR) repeat protein
VNPRAAGAQLELARLDLAQGAIDSSVDLAGRALRNDPANADAQIVLARALLARRDLPGAEAILNKIAVAFPKSVQMHVQLGMVHAIKNEPAKAKEHFDQALALDPNELDALGGLISLDLAARRPDQAKARLDARLARMPGDSGTLLLAGRTYAVIGDVNAAEAAMKKSLQADPDNLNAYQALGSLYMEGQRLPEAQHEFEALAARQHSPVTALTMVGIIQQAQKQIDAARVTFEKALQYDPNAAVAANNLACIYVDQGRNLDLALQLARTAKARLPNMPEVSDTLGWIYYQKGLLGLSITELKDTVKRDPSTALFQYHLGLAYAKNGNRVEARKALETALRLQPDFQGARDAARVLATL